MPLALASGHLGTQPAGSYSKEDEADERRKPAKDDHSYLHKFELGPPESGCTVGGLCAARAVPGTRRGILGFLVVGIETLSGSD